MCTCVHVSQDTCRSQMINYGSGVLPRTVWVLRIELRSLGLVVKSLYGELSCWSSNRKGWWLPGHPPLALVFLLNLETVT